ncbi:Ciliogenesis-associated TTC17-interacting protein [Microtus ochrogaster]|uniref:Ciliogenesis-associated TTC17-interacting protein n=1 Tax=Microtus ochrogaster TaxID=79684 RepID=A0A8J6KV32_MICOH|nr:Ciliogenesis-associated TTC17-interacting protein [Microtus ochrogaster]
MTGSGHKAGKEIADMARGKWVLWGLEAGPGESFSHQTGLEKLLLFFPETLAIVSDTGEPQGELTIEVQKGKYRDEQGILTHCLLVHACSRGFIDKSPCGSSLLGYLTNKLELMEQHSQEFIKQSLGFQTIQLGHQQAEMFIVEQTIHSEEDIPFSCQFYLLSDG